MERTGHFRASEMHSGTRGKTAIHSHLKSLETDLLKAASLGTSIPRSKLAGRFGFAILTAREVIFGRGDGAVEMTQMADA